MKARAKKPNPLIRAKRARVTARRQEKRVRVRGRRMRPTGQVAQVTRQADLPFSNASNDPLLNPRSLAQYPPELQYQAGVYAPGRTPTPFVINDEIYPIRTGVGSGSHTFNAAPTSTKPGFFIFLFPVLASCGSATPIAGIKGDVNSLTDTFSYTDLNATGGLVS